MKKLFLSLMLVAAVAAGFTSCSKDANDDENTTHTQTFMLGEITFHIDNSITIQNIQYNGSDAYNAIVLSKGQLIGETGGEGQGIVILFDNAIKSGTYELSRTGFPRYVFANLSVEDIVNFNFDDLMAQDEVYLAVDGAFTLSIAGSTYTLTSDGIEVEKVSDPEVNVDSSIDYEGSMSHYVMATVEEGTLNDGENDIEIVTASRTAYKFPLVGEKNIACFVTMSGDMIGFHYQGNDIPAGTQANPTFIYAAGMDIEHAAGSFVGSINVEIADDVYTVDITDAVINDKTYNMHYVGTLPYFKFPF